MARSWNKLFKNKSFIYLWISQILSQVTINILNFILLFTLFENTNSSIATSLIWISYALPAIIIGPFSSASVDMLDRRKILVITNLLQSLITLFYGLWINATHFFIYAFVLIYSSINQFYVPAEFATLPYVVRKKLLPEANGLFLITQQGSVVLGFGFAGLILKLLGFQKTIVLCSILLFNAFLATYSLPKMEFKKKMPKYFNKAIISFFENIYSGYDFIIKNKVVLGPFLIMICMQIMLAITTVNTPALASELMKIPINYAGVVLIAPAGFGAMIASFLIPRVLKKGVRKIKVIKYSLLLLSISLFLTVFVFSLFSNVFRIPLSLLSLFFSGASFIGVLIPSQTLLQEKTPHGLRGRVFGNYWFLVTVASVIPVILSGTISEIFGSKILLATLIALVFSLYWFLNKFSKNYQITDGLKV